MKHLTFTPTDIADCRTSGKFVCREGGAVHPDRTLQDFVLLFGSSGEYRISEGGTEYALTPGKFLLLFPDDRHFGTAPCSTGLSHYWCHFRLPQGEILQNSPQTGGEKLVLPTFGTAAAPERVRMLFHQLMDISRRESPQRKRKCDLTLTLLLTELAEADTKTDITAHGAATAAKVAEWIRLYIGEIRSSRDVAAHFGYNCEYLTTAMRRATGKTLSAHIREARVEEAKSLLLCSDLQVKEIGYRCGFADDKYFLRVFRELTGMTPGQYRNAYVRMHYNKS